MKQHGVALFLKKACDRAAALGLLVATAPVVGAAALAVRASMGAPVFFRQPRVGFRNEQFRIFKMRTMTDARAADGALLPDAERLTRLGRFLRSTSIDELPQLWNVLAGDLSLVGPRPLLIEYLPYYSAEQARRHEVVPGITGWAQVHGRNAISWEDKFALDVWYVDHWSPLLDLRVLAKTVRAVLMRDGISSANHVTMPRFDDHVRALRGS
jgi:lipopolysaccharide/colanic/teichoic acid biosynthesis glycosyltransferase